MSESEDIEVNGLIYSINKENKTATVIGNNISNEEIIIPLSINHDSNEYFVTCISTDAFINCVSIRSIKFASDSKVRTISADAFACSTIESLSIPSSVVELEEGWCRDVLYLKRIEIDPKNPLYSTCDGNKYVIGKASKEEKNFDVLIFAARNIKIAMIPDFIKMIAPDSFHRSPRLQYVKFSTNSELQVVEYDAFVFSSIVKFFAPRHLTRIGEFAFHDCRNLREIEFPADCELKIIENEAFSESTIEKFSIPLHLTRICEQAFYKCEQLRSVDVPVNSELQEIEEEAFNVSSIGSFFITKSIKKIGKNAFSICKFLQIVEFEEKSSLFDRIHEFLNSCTDPAIMIPN